MLNRISDNWWMLSYDGDEGRFVWFGFTEDQVKQKFAAWMRRMSMGRNLRQTVIQHNMHFDDGVYE
jgi:hypothetical protein